jgi:MFS family permease
LAINVTVALGFGMVIPVFPSYARSFGVSFAAIGLVQLVFGLTRFSFGLVGGIVVDRFGARASTMAGLLIVSLSSYAAGLASTFPQFVLARGFGGAGSALFIGGLMNRVLRIIEPGAMGRATGVSRSGFLVGIGVGPLLGGYVAKHFGLSAPFHFYATGLLLATVIAYIVMREEKEAPVALDPDAAPAARKRPLDSLRAARPLFRDHRYMTALFATLVGWWTISGPAQVVGPLFADVELDLSPEQIGLAVSMLAIGEVFVLLFAGKASDRYGRRAVLIPSLVITALATIGMGQIAGAPGLYFPLMILIGAGIAAGSTASGGLLADSLPPGGSGAAVGVNQMAGDLGYLVAPVATLWMAEHFSFEVAYAFGAIPAALCIVAAARLPKERPRGPEQADTVEPSTAVG